jgi:hypothetical protein
MYQRTARAAVSTRLENEPETPAPDQEANDSQEQTIWAKVPFQTRKGRCLAVRRRGAQVWVAIAGSPAVRWLPAHQVLTAEEATRWAATCF